MAEERLEIIPLNIFISWLVYFKTPRSRGDEAACGEPLTKAENSQEAVVSDTLGARRAAANFPLWASIIMALTSLLLEHSVPVRMTNKSIGISGTGNTQSKFSK